MARTTSSHRPGDSERLLCPREVAQRTGLSYHAVLRAIHRGELRASRLCQRIRIRPSDVAAWIERNRIGVPGADFVAPPLFSPSPQPPRGSYSALRALEKSEANG